MKQEWENRYRQGQTGWDRGDVSPALNMMLDHTGLTAGKLLTPGCGRGHEVVELARRGFKVTALDISSSAIGHLKRSLAQEKLQAEVLEVDMLQWQTKYPFDAVYEQTSLCALDPVYWEQYEKQLYGWLKPGGFLLALWMQTFSQGGPPYHCDPGSLKQLFPPVRWNWSEQIETVEHPSGRHEAAYVLTRK